LSSYLRSRPEAVRSCLVLNAGACCTQTTHAPMVKMPLIASSDVLLLSGPSTPLHRDLGGRCIDLMAFVGSAFDCGCAQVLVKTRQLSRAWDRDDPRLLGEQPSERDLSRRGILPGCKMAEQINDWLVGLSGIGSKAREPATNVGTGEGHGGVNLPCQEALPKRAPRDEADPELFASGQNLRFGITCPKRIFALEGSDRLNSVRSNAG